MTDMQQNTQPLDLPPESGVPMADNTLDSLQAKLDGLINSIDRLEAHLSTRIDGLEKQITQERASREQAIDTERNARKQAILDETQARHKSEGLEREARLALQSEISAMNKSTTQALSGLGDRVQGVDNKLDSIDNTLAGLSGIIGNWQVVVSRQSDDFKAQQSELDRQRGNISDMKKDTANLRHEIELLKLKANELHVALFGGDDDRQSVVAMIKEANTLMLDNYREQAKVLAILQSDSNDHTKSIKAILDKYAEDKARWQKRKDTAMAVLKSKMFWAVVAGGGSLFGLFSSAEFWAFIQTLIGG